jgi:hypothetical protein
MKWEREAVEDSAGKVMWSWRSGMYQIEQSLADIAPTTWAHRGWRFELALVGRDLDIRIGDPMGYASLEEAKAAAAKHSRGKLLDVPMVIKL